MSTHNICFRGEIRKISIFWIGKSTLTRAMDVIIVLTRQITPEDSKIVCCCRYSFIS